jgi:hypothetical protein
MKLTNLCTVSMTGHLSPVLSLCYTNSQWGRLPWRDIFMKSADSAPHPKLDKAATTPWMGAYLKRSAFMLFASGWLVHPLQS